LEREGSPQWIVVLLGRTIARRGTELSAVVTERMRDGIGVIRLTRPDRLNAINQDVIEGLHAAVDEFEAAAAIRVVVLTGAGKGFCAGLDLEAGHFAMPGTEQMSEVARQLTLQVAIVSILEKIHGSVKPYIAAVNGVAVGGGLALALACDIRIANTAAKFGSVFIKVGASNTDLGISYLLPRIIGAGRSAELLLTGRIIAAEEAERIGLVSRVVGVDDLVATSHEVAGAVASGGAFQLWMTKETMWQNLDAPSLHHATLTENRTQIMASMAGDVDEAIAAFREGRRPSWRAM
jgi:enoyl-CoA hydratase/carnithine racemase